MPRIVLLVAEIHNARTDADVQEALDCFREATVPSQDYGLMIARATAKDVARFDLCESGMISSKSGRLD